MTALLRRSPTVDFRTATAAGLEGLDDVAVLAIAAREGRVLVTHDHTTMPAHFETFVRSTPSPGLVVVSQRLAIRDTVDDLLLAWTATAREERVKRIVYLPL